MHRHEFDPISALFGVAFTTAATVALLTDERLFDVDARWVWPVVVIGIGLSMLGSALRPRKVPITDDIGMETTDAANDIGIADEGEAS